MEVQKRNIQLETDHFSLNLQVMRVSALQLLRRDVDMPYSRHEKISQVRKIHIITAVHGGHLEKFQPEEERSLRS